MSRRALLRHDRSRPTTTIGRGIRAVTALAVLAPVLLTFTQSAASAATTASIDYTVSDVPAERELISLDGQQVDGPLHIYVNVSESAADSISRVVLLSGDRELWTQRSWPYGDYDPVDLADGEHTVRARIVFRNGTTQLTDPVTFQVGALPVGTDGGASGGAAGQAALDAALQYTVSDEPAAREMLDLDGQQVEAPLHVYLDIAKSASHSVSRVVLREGDRELWTQRSWPYGDYDPVDLADGEHTLHAEVVYADGSTKRTTNTTFTVGDQAPAEETNEPVTAPEPVTEPSEPAPSPQPADAAYPLEYTVSDTVAERELLALDGQDVVAPLHVYVGMARSDSDGVSHVVLREGDRELWTQRSWPYGDFDPVDLDAGEHTLHAEIVYADGSTERTADTTFNVTAAELVEQPADKPVDQPSPNVPGGSWKQQATYSRGDTVTFDGSTYTATRTITGESPQLGARVGYPVGFGANATGGEGGEIRWVTSNGDSGSGTLRDALSKPGPAWIRFKTDGPIKLNKEIRVPSNVTIDGRDADVTITGHGLYLREVRNVIITDLTMTGGADDAIQVIHKTRDVWLNRLHLSNYKDGLIDITRESTDVTVSHTRLHNHSKAMLINGGWYGEESPKGHVPPSDGLTQVTVHDTVFDGTEQRNPKARWVKLHMFNNVIDGWKYYGTQAERDAQVFIESNVYGDGARNTPLRVLYTGAMRSEGNLGANLDVKPSDVFTPTYSVEVDEATTGMANTVRSMAGPRGAGEAWVRSS